MPSLREKWGCIAKIRTMRSETVPPDFPGGMDEGQFLAGPRRDSHSLDVDPCFGSGWDLAKTDMIFDLRLRSWEDLTAWAETLLDRSMSGDCPTLMVSGGILFLPAISRDGSWEEGVVALDPADEEFLVGLYCGVTLCVRSDRQGQGIGSGLVLCRFLRDGALPAWEAEVPAYSPAGLAAHRAAFRALRTMFGNDPYLTSSPT